MKRKESNAGFSLVELIIVVGIMAVLAASIAPAVIRYVQRSKESKAITEAGYFVSATQNGFSNATVASAPMNLDKHFVKSDGTVVKCGVITNEMLSKAKERSGVAANAADYGDYLLSIEILNDVSAGSSANNRFQHTSGTAENPIGKSCSAFDDCTGVIIVYNEEEQVVMLEYYSKGILVHYEDGEYTVNASDSFISESRIQQ